MRKNPFYSALAVLLFVLNCPAEAQQKGKLPVLGWLSARPASLLGLERFRPGLQALGYMDGKNIAFEPRYANNDFDRLPALAAELVSLQVDVLVTPSTIEAFAAKNATKTIPIVFLNAADPIASGLVDSLARPGSNITGLTNLAGVLAGKRLELLKEIIPKLARVAVLWDPRAPGSATMERKPLSRKRTGLAAPFHGSKQHRQNRGRVQRGNEGARRRDGRDTESTVFV